MRKIYKNEDLKLRLNTYATLIDAADTLVIKLWTFDELYNLTKTKADLDDYTLNLNWDELNTLGEGILHYMLNLGINDSKYPDLLYNKTEVRPTDYYICSDTIYADSEIQEKTVADYLDEKIDTEISDRAAADTVLQTNIDALTQTVADNKTDAENAVSAVADDLAGEVVRATAAELNLQSQVADGLTALANEITARAAADTVLQTNIDALTQTVADNKTTSETAISDEATRAQTAENNLNSLITALTTTVVTNKTASDTAESNLSDRIDSLTTTVTNNKTATDTAISTVSDNLTAEITRATTAETELSNIVAENEEVTAAALTQLHTDIRTETIRAAAAERTITDDISALQTAVSSKADSADVYTKSEVDQAISNIDVTEQLNNYYTKDTVDTKLARKANTADLATVATTGNYNDLNNKPIIPTVPTNVSAFVNDSGYLTQHQSLSNYYTKIESDAKYITEHQDISGKQDILSGTNQQIQIVNNTVGFASNLLIDCGEY